jgi:Ca2+-transporting ATPase
MFLLLLATGAVYLVLGSIEEAVALGASILVVIGITLYQETKTERTLQALRDLSSPRAMVIRMGRKSGLQGGTLYGGTSSCSRKEIACLPTRSCSPRSI